VLDEHPAIDEHAQPIADGVEPHRVVSARCDVAIGPDEVAAAVGIRKAPISLHEKLVGP
jgi:hypothetical protein